MQFLEYYSGGLRSPVLRFERPGQGVEFRLFPTVHIGDPAYYASILRHLADCDRVLYEHFETFDIGPNDHDGWRTGARRLGLVSQLDAIDYECVPATWVMADLSPGHWANAVAALPSWLERVQFQARAQAVVARLHALLPLPSREELAAACDMSQVCWEDLYATTPLDTLIMDDRNRVLFNAIKTCHAVRVRDPADPFLVGVFYGAAHMPFVAEYLTERLKYVCRRAAWVDPPVFTW